MIVYPAIDLRGGRAVQWVGGRPESEVISLPDPVALARHWIDVGFSTLHIVDLDAALGNGNNRATIAAILAAVNVPVQVGGGLRDDGDVEAMLAAGAARVLVGTRAVADRPWLASLAARHPGRIVVAADCRDGEVVTHGWTAGASIPVERFVASLGALPLGGVLVTDVGREGRLVGPDVPFLCALAAATPLPLLAAGGIRSTEDLERLEGAGVAGAVLGMALYRGTLDAPLIAREWGEPSPAPRPWTTSPGEVAR
jgi:phosphoribosylformimino-5-aminoimidazole carboxamide ribotide isomerase